MRCLTIVSVVAALASTCAAPSRAQENRATPSIAESGLKVLVRVRARSISSDESRFDSRGFAASYEFSAGESMSFLVTAGRTDRDRGDVCTAGSSGPLSFVAPEFQANIARQEAIALYAWHVDIRMVEVHASTMTFDVTWQRTSHGASEEKIEKTQFSQRLVLRYDESRVIDLIRGAPSRISAALGDVDCLGVMIVVEGGITEDPSLQGKTIEWDLWANIGAATSPHQRLRSVQGGVAEFMFDPIAVPGS